MNEKKEWLLIGWISGLIFVLWGLIGTIRNGLWTSLILSFFGVIIIIFTMVVYKNGDK